MLEVSVWSHDGVSRDITVIVVLIIPNFSDVTVLIISNFQVSAVKVNTDSSQTQKQNRSLRFYQTGRCTDCSPHVIGRFNFSVLLYNYTTVPADPDESRVAVGRRGLRGLPGPTRTVSS